MSETSPQFVRELRDELVAAAQRRIALRKRRQRQIIGTLTTILLATMATLTLQMQESPSQASALDVRRVGDSISVDLKAADARSDAIVRELKAFGIEAKINEAPSSPGGVGKFINVDTPNVETIVMPTGYTNHFTLPNSNHREITITRGRPARPGESYSYSPNAYLPGEPLHCSSTLGRQVKDATKALHQRNVTLDWQLMTSATTAVSEESARNYWIVSAVSHKPGSVLIFVSPEPIALAGTTTDCGK